MMRSGYARERPGRGRKRSEDHLGRDFPGADVTSTQASHGVEIIPLTVQTEAEHGGRWTSLRGGGREWLWHRDEPRRAHVIPGDAFADAGGLEECVPTVRGVPDHGDAWSRAWTVTDDAEFGHVVRCMNFELTRRIGARSGAVVAEYRLAAEPGFRFVWAAHALLDLSEHALLQVDQNTKTRLFPDAAPYLRGPWPDGAHWIEGDWPAPAGLRLDALGPDDGSAVGAVMYGGRSAATAVVHDGRDHLRMTVEADGQATAVALWRNLGGFPPGSPYRSIGVEPMLGRVFDLAQAGHGDCAVTPATGEVRWRLTITAYHQEEGADNRGSSGPAA